MADAGEILEEYLERLDRELVGVPASERAEIILDVREHFEEARRDLDEPSEADLRNILERLGPPAEIAGGSPAPAAVDKEPETRRYGALEVAALVLWVIWWPLGALLTGLSPRWSRQAKAIAIVTQLCLIALIESISIAVNHFSANFPLVLHSVILVVPPTLLGFTSAGYLAWKLSNSNYVWGSNWRFVGRGALVVLGVWLLSSLLVAPLVIAMTR